MRIPITDNLRSLDIGESFTFDFRRKSAVDSTIQRMKAEHMEFGREKKGNKYNVTRKK